MVRKSILTCLAVLVAYEILHPLIPRSYLAPTGRHENLQRAERYLYECPLSGRDVLVGSSMSQLLTPYTEPAVINLSFSNSSALTGLEVLHLAHARPRMVLIEINTINRGSDKALVEHLAAPGLWSLRRHLTMLQDKNRPFDIAAGITASMPRRLRTAITRIPRSPSEKALNDTPELRESNPALFRELFENQRRTMALAPEKSLLESRLMELDVHVRNLEDQGCICIFFEAPVDSALVQTKWCVAIREACHSRYPEGRYHWITPDSRQDYSTSDGIHLAPSSARAFSEYLLERASGIMARRQGLP
jgi:hypothetical protein